MKRLIITGLLFISLFATAYGAVDGRKVVASAGTAEALSATDTTYELLVVCAESDNTGIIAVGRTPVAAAGSQEGVLLRASSCFTSDNKSRLRNIYVDATVSGEGVAYYYEG